MCVRSRRTSARARSSSPASCVEDGAERRVLGRGGRRSSHPTCGSSVRYGCECASRRCAPPRSRWYSSKNASSSAPTVAFFGSGGYVAAVISSRSASGPRRRRRSTATVRAKLDVSESTTERALSSTSCSTAVTQYGMQPCASPRVSVGRARGRRRREVGPRVRAEARADARRSAARVHPSPRTRRPPPATPPPTTRTAAARSRSR